MNKFNIASNNNTINNNNKKKHYYKHQIVFYVSIIVIWEIIASLDVIPSNVLPSPLEILDDMVFFIENGTLVHGFFTSLWRLSVGLILSIIGGVLLGILFAKSHIANKTAGGLILGLQSVPSIAWVPLGILWFGLTDMGIIFIIVIGAMFAISINTQTGIQNLNPEIVYAAQNLGKKNPQFIFDVLLPASLPYLVVGLRQGWAFAWRGLIGAELLFSYLGLGYMLYVGRSLNDISQVFAVMIIIMAIGFSVDMFIFNRIEGWIREKWGFDST